jgi:Uma2 family endonuclease
MWYPSGKHVSWRGGFSMATMPKTQAPWGEYVPLVGPMTAEQFEQFPGVEDWVYELHEGRLIAMPGPGSAHMAIQTRVYRCIDPFLQQHNLGILFGTGCFYLPLPGNTTELLCPDLSYVLPDRLLVMLVRGSYYVGAPDLAVEIASPSDTHPGLAAKAKVYLEAGVRLVWVLWPDTKTIEVWRPESLDTPVAVAGIGDSLDAMGIIPGFSCAVNTFFGV